MSKIYNFFYVSKSNEYLTENPTLLTMAKIKNEPKQELCLHMHSYLEVFYFESGNGRFVCDNQVVPIKAHTLLAVNTSTMHLQDSADSEKPLVYYTFAVDNINISSYDKNTLSHQSFAYAYLDDEKNSIYRNILTIMQELKNRNSLYHIKVLGAFYEFITETVRILTNTDKERPKIVKSLDNAQKFIKTYYFKDLTLDEIAKNSFMGTDYFRHTFTQQYNISPMQYLNTIRIENAKLLLIKTLDSITSISLQVGFNNPAYFSEIFKKIEGMTPKQYRMLKTTDLTPPPKKVK